jgi:hypothetical protein
MFRLYLEILNLNVALSAFAVVTVAIVSGRDLASQDFIFPVGYPVPVDVTGLHPARAAAPA